MLWLILLGVATCLLIALRRVLRRQAPLDDELYSTRVAVDYVQSGVGWVRGDGMFGSVNQSFAKTFGMEPREFVGKEWYKVFGAKEQTCARESYSQMMLMGMTGFEAAGERADGLSVWLNVRLVAVHDGQMRFVGHHCMIEDKTREHELELQLQALEKIVARFHAHEESPKETATQSMDALRRATSRNVISVLDHARDGARDGARRATREPVSQTRAAS